MFSRTLRNLVTVLLISTFILSCDLKIGETPPAAAIPEYRASSCFTTATDSFSNFFSGTATEQEIGDSWDCFASMVKEFKSKVRCKIREQCSPGEIAQFVEDNFLDENKGAEVKQKAFSAELQIQFMKIKKLFLGGNLEYISPAELDRLIGLMGNLKALSVDINPSMKVLTLNWENKLKSDDLSLFDFEAVNENLVKMVGRLSDMIDKKENVYYFDDFQSLVNEMGRFVGTDWSWLESVRNYLPLIKKLKKSITGGEEESLKDNEWNLFLLMGSRAYIQFLRYYYFIKDLEPEFASLRLAYSARTVEEIFQMFYDLLSYKESHQVSKAEIEDLFLSFSNIWPVFKTSPGFVTELMKIKQVLIGGSGSGFEKDDFLRAQKKVNLIKQVVEKFTPYYQFYGLSWRPELLKQSEAFAYFSKATKNFDDLITKLTDEFKFESGYELKNLLNLMSELEKLYPSIKENSMREKILEYACLIQLGTDVLLDKNNNQNKNSCDQIELTSYDLTRLFKMGSQVFTIFWDYHYFVSRTKVLFNDLEFQVKFRDFGYNIVSFLKKSIEQRKSKRISYYELKLFTNELTNIGMIPKQIKKSTIESLMQVVVSKILVPDELKLKKTRFDGLEPFHIEQIYRELDNYLGINIFIHQAFENKINQKFDYNFLLARFKQSISDSNNPNFKLGMTEFVKNFQSPYPLTITTDDRIFLRRNTNPTYDKKTLEKYNLNRFLAGIFLRSYARRENAKTVNNILTDCEVKAAFDDLRPILVDLDVISASSGTGFIDARFIEANLFLTKSDGNDTVSYEELAEFVNYVFSGFTIDAVVKRQVNKTCETEVINKDVMVSLACLRDTYKNNVKTLMNSMPAYVTYTENENQNDWNDAFFNNLKAAGYKPRPDLKVSLSDASLFPHILQYGETLFIKFDVNSDGFIDKKESMRAFPSFAFLLKKVARKQLEDGTIKESDLEATFTYILKYGKIPECNKPFVLLCLFDRDVQKWLDWKANYRRDDYNLMANRSQISKILGIIADMVKTSPSVKEDNSCK
jgi:hypothetical protein